MSYVEMSSGASGGGNAYTSHTLIGYITANSSGRYDGLLSGKVNEYKALAFSLNKDSLWYWCIYADYPKQLMEYIQSIFNPTRLYDYNCEVGLYQANSSQIAVDISTLSNGYANTTGVLYGFN